MFQAIINLINDEIKKGEQYIIKIKPYKKHLYCMIYIIIKRTSYLATICK